jgi:F-type H+-transporting ATPase subunit b
MLYLVDFSVIKPDPGLIFWTTIIFLTFWGLMAKFAFKPIGNALRKREQDIQNALDAAKVARAEMENLKEENEELLAKAREERTLILKEAKEARDYMISEAKKRAKEEAAVIVQNARNDIENQKMAAIKELKNEVAGMAVEIAGKVLRRELNNDQAQKEYVESLIEDIKLN